MQNIEQRSVLPASDKNALLAFQNKVSDLMRSSMATDKVMGEMSNKLKHIKAAIQQTPGVSLDLMKEVKALEQALREASILMDGDGQIARHEIETNPGISERLGIIVWSMWNATSAPTNTSEEQYQDAGKEFEAVLATMKDVVARVAKLEQSLEGADAPFTPGRLPDWKLE